MAGYAVASRVDGRQMRLTFAGCLPLAERAASDSPAPVVLELAPLEELSGEPFAARLRARWRERREDLAVAWRQTTFYLFDAHSWL